MNWKDEYGTRRPDGSKKTVRDMTPRQRKRYRKKIAVKAVKRGLIQRSKMPQKLKVLDKIVKNRKAQGRMK